MYTLLSLGLLKPEISYLLIIYFVFFSPILKYTWLEEKNT